MHAVTRVAGNVYFCDFEQANRDAQRSFLDPVAGAFEAGALTGRDAIAEGTAAAPDLHDWPSGPQAA